MLLKKGRFLCSTDLSLYCCQDAKMLSLEGFEVVIQLLVPRVQHTNLEAERRAGDNKVGDGEGACDDHGGRRKICCWMELKFGRTTQSNTHTM
jgi:hypothetical protein